MGGEGNETFANGIRANVQFSDKIVIGQLHTADKRQTRWGPAAQVLDGANSTLVGRI